MKKSFINPQNNYVVATSNWSIIAGILFCPIYLAVKGVWGHAIVSGLLCFFTFGLANLVYGCFATKLVHAHYLKNGYKPISNEEAARIGITAEW